jgi:hypothetical protein
MSHKDVLNCNLPHFKKLKKKLKFEAHQWNIRLQDYPPHVCHLYKFQAADMKAVPETLIRQIFSPNMSLRNADI